MCRVVSPRARWCQVGTGTLACQALLVLAVVIPSVYALSNRQGAESAVPREEIIRKWFPAPIALKSSADGWLTESLEEYLVWRHVQEKNPQAAQSMVTQAVRDAMSRPLRPISMGLKLLEQDREASRITLRAHGMLVWRTLETVIDRERVDRALREFAVRYGGGSAGIADFRKICEEISGRDLKWFFDYYLGGVDLPRIELHRVPGAAPNEVSGEIIVSFVPHGFQVRVELLLHTASGQAIRHSVATKGAVTRFTVSTTEVITRITVDPDSRILRDLAISR